ncbi:hypothetical protein JL193_16490 [Polaribacter batillariae]|uniref:Uncharacterized protein n=1 Tax=Polaribacter batillariae TaxID=2808900 RepID=A0ABX7SVU0_9FLAO|nr:hypothetical protein [Polaribacter batillariae]QTD37641.1 hypothetical protein JL193_16490 [Polaribacter batillariae]
MNNKILKITILTFGMLFNFACSKPDTLEVEKEPEEILETDTEIGFVKTLKGNYNVGEQVEIVGFNIKNTSSTKVKITEISSKIRGFGDDKSVKYSAIISENIEIPIGGTFSTPQKSIFTIPNSLAKDAYAVSIYLKFSDGAQRELYKTFFRVSDTQTLLTYKIDKEEYNGLPVFKLRGGLSAEYTVQKSAASFVSGISHSWTSPIETIASTPDFLERSINNTIDFYDGTVGATTPIETVIISTGIPGVQYLARNMKGVVLPLHFLVASGTVKEAQTILEYANNSGYKSYGTIGHDFSITNTQSVGWIKLLDLPTQYKKFIEDHQVKNVILLGHTGTDDGETQAQKVADTRGKYEENSLYLMRFSGDASDGYLKQILSDYEATRLSSVTKVADWEAGIIPAQINNFSASVKAKTSATVTAVTANDGVHLWNLGTYTSLALIKKNQTIFEVGGPAVRGISTNQYLLGNPSYESYIRYVPFLYFAGFTAEFQYNNWLSTKIKSAVNSYFPDIVFEDLTFWTNDASMDALLKTKGLKVRSSNYSAGQVWDISNGLNSLTEVRAVDILSKTTPSAFKTWNDNLEFLDLNDLQEVSNKFPEIKVEQK